MKTFLIILIIYLLALKTKEVEKVVLIQDNNKANIIITPDNLRCKTVLHINSLKHIAPHKKALKLGKNEFDFIPFENMRIELTIYKY